MKLFLRFQDVVELAARYNYTHTIQDIRPDDVLVFLNTDISSIPFAICLMAIPIPIAVVGFVLVAYLTHKKIMSQMRTTSTANYKLQKSISLLLIAHVRTSLLPFY